MPKAPTAILINNEQKRIRLQWKDNFWRKFRKCKFWMCELLLRFSDCGV